MRKQQRGVSIMGLLTVLVLFIVVALFAMKVIPSFMEYPHRQVGDRGDRAPGRDQPGRRAARVREPRARSTTSSPCRPQDLEITRDGNQVVIAFAYRKEIPLFAGVGLYIDYAAELEGPVELLGHTFADATSPRAGADAPQPRRGPQRAAGIPRRRGARLRRRRRALRPLPAASRRQADPAAREPGARGVPRPGGARARPGRPGARRHAAGPAVGPRRCAGGGVRRDLPRRRLRRGAARGGAGAWPAARAGSTRREWRRTRRPACRSCCTRAASRCPSTAWSPRTVRPMSAPSTSNVLVGELASTGHGTSRQRAEQEAAKAMLEKLQA